MEPLNIYLWMEDFDNVELSEDERKEQLRESVLTYNEQNGSGYNADSMVQRYLRIKKYSIDL